MSSVMNAKDSVSGSLADCFITLNGNRYKFIQMTDFESKYEPNIVEVPILGQINKGHKVVGGKGTWSGTAHYNQSIMREIMYKYQTTGVMDYFDIQVSNEDPTSSVGRQSVIHRDCLLDSVVLAKMAADEENLTEELSGTFEYFELPEKFRTLDEMM